MQFREHGDIATRWLLIRVFTFAFLQSGCTLLPEKAVLLDEDNDGFTYDLDCDDDNANVSPIADEVLCDGTDNDCDPTTADDDLDGDGFGAPTCGGEDCDDSDPAVNPLADELCDDDHIDEDCDGLADDEDLDGAEGSMAWYPDDDGDDAGAEDIPTYACQQPEGYVLEDTDCDDDDSYAYPGAKEYCDDVDNDCDGDVDELEDLAVVTLNLLTNSTLTDCPDDYCEWDALDRSYPEPFPTSEDSPCFNDPWGLDWSGFTLDPTAEETDSQVFYTDHGCWGTAADGTNYGIQSILSQNLPDDDDFGGWFVAQVDYLSEASGGSIILANTGALWAPDNQRCEIVTEDDGAWHRQESCGPIEITSAAIAGDFPLFGVLQTPYYTGGIVYVDNPKLYYCEQRPD